MSCRLPLFAILAPVVELFYILVIVQVALGVYSLWEGFQWVRLVRRRLGAHSGFYAPVAALICPCKGNEPGLEENLAALASFDYPNYEIYFSLASSLDPAVKAIEFIKTTSPHPVHIVIAGPAQDCSEKVFNLRRAVESLPESVEVFVFTDSDVRYTRGWLRNSSHRFRTPALAPPRAIAGLFPVEKSAPVVLQARWRRPGTRRLPPCSGGPEKISAGEAARPSGAALLKLHMCWTPGAARRATISR